MNCNECPTGQKGRKFRSGTSNLARDLPQPHHHPTNAEFRIDTLGKPNDAKSFSLGDGGVRHHQTTGFGSCKVFKAVGNHAGDHGYDWFEDQRIRFAVDILLRSLPDSEKFCLHHSAGDTTRPAERLFGDFEQFLNSKRVNEIEGTYPDTYQMDWGKCNVQTQF